MEGFLCSWCLMLMLRTAVLIKAKQQWVSRLGSGALFMCAACVAVPNMWTFRAATLTSLVFQWSSLPHELDNSGFFAMIANFL